MAQTSYVPTTDRSGVTAVIRRAGRTILLSGIVVATLLVFPNALPWMLAFWLAWHTLLALRARPAWLPLAACLAVVIAKRPDWSPGLIALAALMLIVCLWRACRPRLVDTRWGKRLAAYGCVTLWATWAGLLGEQYHATHIDRRPTLVAARPVVCIGDSLTAFGYPRVLAQRLSVPVVDLSRDGMAASEAVSQLPELIAAKPQAVVVELGGHDFLRGYGRAATRASLERIIDACQSVGAEVVLLEIPRGFITDPFDGLERQLARRRDLELIPDTAIRRLVLCSRAAPPGMWLSRAAQLSDDGLHPNKQGNAMLADYVAAALGRIFGPAVLASGQRQQTP